MADKKPIRVMENEYLVTVRCTNCGRVLTAAIRKGYTAEEALETEPICPNCKCSTLVFVPPNN